jgi:hypothetical protein
VVDVLLTEQAFLLMVAGRSASWADPSVIAGALLLDLERRGGLGEDDGALVARGCDPGHQLLHRAHAAIAGASKRREVKQWVKRLPKELGTLNRDLARAQLQRGLLVEVPERRLGLRSRTGLRASATAPKDEFYGRLLSAFNAVGELAEDDRLLVALLFPGDLVTRVPEERRRDAGDWLIDIRRGWSDETADEGRRIQAAVLAAVDDALVSNSVRWAVM